MIIAATKGCELLWAIAIRERPYPKEIMDKAIDTLMKMLTCQDKEVKTKFLNKCIESL